MNEKYLECSMLGIASHELLNKFVRQLTKMLNCDIDGNDFVTIGEYQIEYIWHGDNLGAWHVSRTRDTLSQDIYVMHNFESGIVFFEFRHCCETKLKRYLTNLTNAYERTGI